MQCYTKRSYWSLPTFLAGYVCNYLHMRLHHERYWSFVSCISHRITYNKCIMANFLMCVTKKKTHHSLKSCNLRGRIKRASHYRACNTYHALISSQKSFFPLDGRTDRLWGFPSRQTRATHQNDWQHLIYFVPCAYTETYITLYAHIYVAVVRCP